MENSKHFEEVKGYYSDGYWKINRVWSAVGKWITEEEYTTITGYTYPNKE